MKKSTSIFLLTITFFISLVGSCFADSEIIKKQYKFLGENNEFLAEIVTTTAKIRPTPKIPAEISLSDAIKLWQGEKISPKKECNRTFTDFVDGIHAIKKCVEISARLQPTPEEPLNIIAKKTSTPESSAIIFLPILGVIGIITLAFVFISAGAPARFMMQYGGVMVIGMMITLAINSLLSLDSARTATGILLSIVIIHTTYKDNNGLIVNWIRTYPALGGAGEQKFDVIIQFFATMLMPGFFSFSLTFINSVSVGVEFIWFVATWFLVATFIIFIANFFPLFRNFRRR